MQKQFKLLSPTKFEKDFKQEVSLGWAIISHRLLSDKKSRRRAYGHWFRIKSEKKEIFRLLRFSPNLKGGQNNEEWELVVDRCGWLALNDYAEEEPNSIMIEISEAHWWQFLLFIYSHPDPIYRLSSYLGLLSVLLGILSIILALK